MNLPHVAKTHAAEFADSAIFFWLVEGMDLPTQRVITHDYRWLIRNAGFRNSNHPKFPELMNFIKRKILE